MSKTPRPRPAVMTLTPAAVARVNQIMAQNTDRHALRIGVKKGGCAGMEYTMDWVNAPGKFDEVIEQDGARVLIDPAAVLFLFGTEMDYRVEMLSAEFVFNNPNQTSACGCGESVELTPVDKSRFEPMDA